MTTKTIPNPTKTQKTSKNKVIAFRFALTPDIETVINSLQKSFIGLDKSEIVKLALNQLYTNSNLISNQTNNQIQSKKNLATFINNLPLAKKKLTEAEIFEILKDEDLM
jgi:hypothetical protein